MHVHISYICAYHINVHACTYIIYMCIHHLSRHFLRTLIFIMIVLFLAWQKNSTFDPVTEVHRFEIFLQRRVPLYFLFLLKKNQSLWKWEYVVRVHLMSRMRVHMYVYVYMCNNTHACAHNAISMLTSYVRTCMYIYHIYVHIWPYIIIISKQRSLL